MMDQTDDKKCCSGCVGWGYALPRAGIGLLFLMAGVGKLLYPQAWLHGETVHNFAMLPPLILNPYMIFLPFAETLVGTCLILGLFTRPALKLAGLLLLSLQCGLMLTHQYSTVANNFVYLIAVAVLLCFANHNAWALDCFRKGKPENHHQDT